MSAMLTLLDRISAELTSKAVKSGPSWAQLEGDKIQRALWAADATVDGARGLLAIVEESQDDERSYRIYWLQRRGIGDAIIVRENWNLTELDAIERGGEDSVDSVDSNKEDRISALASPTNSTGGGLSSCELILTFSGVVFNCVMLTPSIRDEALWRLLIICYILADFTPSTVLTSEQLREIGQNIIHGKNKNKNNNNMGGVMATSRSKKPELSRAGSTIASGGGAANNKDEGQRTKNTKDQLEFNKLQNTDALLKLLPRDFDFENLWAQWAHLGGVVVKQQDKDIEAERILDEVIRVPSSKKLSAIELDNKLVSSMEDVEQETVESLLAWELTYIDGEALNEGQYGAESGSSAAHGAQPLLDTLNELDVELVAMEGWLESNSSYVDEMRSDMLSIETLNNKLETRSRNYEKLSILLGILVESISIPKDTENLLRNPAPLLEQALPHQIEDIVCEITAAMGALRSALNAVEVGGYPVDKLAEFHAMQGNGDQQAEFAATKWRHEMAQEQFRLLSAVREQRLALTEISTQFSTELGFALASSFQKYCLPHSNKHSHGTASEVRRSSKSPSRSGLNTWGEEDDSDENEDRLSAQLNRGESSLQRSDSVGSYESRDSYSSRGNGFGLMPRTMSKGVKLGAMKGKIGTMLKIRKPGFGSTSRKFNFAKLTPLPPGASRIRLEKAQMSVHHALVDFDPLFESLFEMDPKMLVGLCKCYASESANLFYLHSKAIFRALSPKPQPHALLSLSALSKASVSTSVSEDFIGVNHLKFLQSQKALFQDKLFKEQELLKLVVEEHEDYTDVMNPDKINEEPEVEPEEEEDMSSPENQHVPIYFTDVLLAVFDATLPTIKKERSFMFHLFRLYKAHEKMIEMFASGGLSNVTADTPTTPSRQLLKQSTLSPAAFASRSSVASGEDSKGLPSSNVDELIASALSVQWKKLIDKLKVMIDAPELSSSAELLTMLRAVNDRLETLNDKAKNQYEEDEDEDKRSEEVWLTSRLVEMSVSLTRRWNALVDEQASYIFSNLNASTDVRQCGILPVFTKFVSFVDNVETQVTYHWWVNKKQVNKKPILKATLAASKSLTITAPSSVLLSKDSSHGNKTRDDDDDAESRSSGPLGIAYMKLSNALFSSLEKAAAANEKYRDVARLENYYYFAAAVGNLVRATKENALHKMLVEQQEAERRENEEEESEPSSSETSAKKFVHELDGSVSQAWTHYEENVSRYLAWNFRYEFSELHNYFNDMEKLVNSRGIEDVHIHLSKESLISTMSTHGNMKRLKDKIQNIYKRCTKHLSKELGLIDKIWLKFAFFLESTWDKFALRSKQCYDFKLEPDADVVKAMVLQIGGLDRD